MHRTFLYAPQGDISHLIELPSFSMQHEESKQSKKDKLHTQNQPIPPGIVRISIRIRQQYGASINVIIVACVFKLVNKGQTNSISQRENIGQPT